MWLFDEIALLFCIFHCSLMKKSDVKDWCLIENFCLNGGTCINDTERIENYEVCLCADNYYGLRCQYDGRSLDECTENQIKCDGEKTCYTLLEKCNFRRDCEDSSDERDCPADNCTEHNFLCGTGICINKKWVCDGENDCGDFSDEFPSVCANQSCPVGFFTCKNQRCIKAPFLCDGEDDCYDLSDETPPVCHIQPRCKAGGHHCKSTDSCVPQEVVCDGIEDCEDRSDERHCSSTPLCLGFQCEKNVCINKKKVCDGYNDCLFGNDESNCSFVCKPGFIRCLDTFQCFNSSGFCDKKRDCRNGFDESPFCNQDECMIENGGCSQICKDLNVFRECLCYEGYQKKSTNILDPHCIDVNECLVLGICSQMCRNFPGGYQCSCINGYELRDKRFCDVPGDGFFLHILGNNTIGQVIMIKDKYKKLDEDYHVILNNISIGSGSSYHAKHNYIYWTDKERSVISRLNLLNANKSIPRNLIKEDIIQNLNGVYAISIDWVGLKLYWTLPKDNLIEVSELDGSNMLQLVNANKPFALVVDPSPSKRFLYWLEMGFIWAISMDGEKSTKHIVYKSHQILPYTLVLDFPTEMIYWFDLNYIYCVGTNGQDFRRVIQRFEGPFTLGLFLDDVIWIEKDFVVKSNKFKGSQVTRLIASPSSDSIISVYNGVLQPEIPNPCANIYCSHLCLLSHNTLYRCACPTGIELLSNGFTCNTPDAFLCKEDFCLNHGACIDKKGKDKVLPFCQCKNGYAGYRCQNKLDLHPLYENGSLARYRCVSWYCKNGGVCKERDDFNKLLYKPICKCPRDYDGERCTSYIGAYLTNNPSTKAVQEKFSLPLIITVVAAVLVCILIFIGVQMRRYFSRRLLAVKNRCPNGIDSNAPTNSQCSSKDGSLFYLSPAIQLDLIGKKIRSWEEEGILQNLKKIGTESGIARRVKADIWN